MKLNTNRILGKPQFKCIMHRFLCPVHLQGEEVVLVVTTVAVWMGVYDVTVGELTGCVEFMTVATD